MTHSYPIRRSSVLVGAEQEGLRLARNIAGSALVDRRDIIFVEQIVGVCAQLEIVVHGIAEQRVDDRIALGARGRDRGAIGPAPHSAGVADAARDLETEGRAIAGTGREAGARDRTSVV